MTAFPRRCSFREEAEYLPNGLPANMAAVLADQCKRTDRARKCCRS